MSNKITISIIIILILSSVIYSNVYPNKTIVLSKKHNKGYSFKDKNLSIKIYPSYEIKVANAFNVKNINVTKNQYDKIKRFNLYKTKYPLIAYY